MAIIQLPVQPTIGGSFGAGLSGGLSDAVSSVVSSMQSAAQQRVKDARDELKRKQMFESFKNLGFTEKESQAYANLSLNNPNVLQTIIREKLIGNIMPSEESNELASSLTSEPTLREQYVQPIMPQEQKVTQVAAPQKKAQITMFSNVKKMKAIRAKILKDLASKRVTEQESIDSLINQGLSEDEAKIIISPVMTKDTVRFFMDKANNDVNKAKKLAKAYGFRM